MPGQIKPLFDDDLFQWLCSIRRKIHQWPEPAFEEHRTAGVIADALKSLSLWHKTGVAKTGVVARLSSGNEHSPVVALRADVDALPIAENTGLPFSSQVPGYMHACGHDGHIAMLIGAAALLRKSPPDGDVVFIFQPAEEGGGGAGHIIAAGVLDDVDMIFGGHIDRHLRTGEIGMRRGIETSYTDALEIKIEGKGGHAARPHEAVDAVLVASLFVVSLQTIISRSIDPLSPAVITIGSLHSGTAYNAIADKATLRGTIRCIDSSVRTQVIEKIRQTASSLASLHDAEIFVNVHEGYPPIINSDEGYEVARSSAEAIVGGENIISILHPSMGGEDFSYYLQKVPGCFVRFGASMDGSEYVASHSAAFDFDEEAIRVGAAFLAEAARRAIESLKVKRRGA
jgi:hippurate hydrolase